MYSEILFLYYFNDLKGAVLTSVMFCIVTFIGSVVASYLPDIWYGAGMLAGALVGWTVAYFRLRWVEKNLDRHIFCRGSILKKGKGKKPSYKIYDVYNIPKKKGAR